MQNQKDSNHTTIVVTKDVHELLVKEKKKVEEFLGEKTLSFSKFFKIYSQGVSPKKLIGVINEIRKAKAKMFDIIDGNLESVEK